MRKLFAALAILSLVADAGAGFVAEDLQAAAATAELPACHGLMLRTMQAMEQGVPAKRPKP